VKVVFDTNVLLAAFLTEGLCAKLLLRAKKKDFQLYVSKFILDEFSEILRRKFLATKQEIHDAAALIEEAGILVEILKTYVVQGVCRDKDDDNILSCAVAADAEYIVTGDNHLFEIKSFKGIKIIKPREFELLFDTGTLKRVR
jgi:putative PIN family toxin of toxin-antitoxin system